MKKPWNTFICILIYFACSEEIAVENNGKFPAKVKKTFYHELNKTFENLTTFGYEISHFNDKHAEVRNIFGQIKDF